MPHSTIDDLAKEMKLCDAKHLNVIVHGLPPTPDDYGAFLTFENKELALSSHIQSVERLNGKAPARDATGKSAPLLVVLRNVEDRRVLLRNAPNYALALMLWSKNLSILTLISLRRSTRKNMHCALNFVAVRLMGMWTLSYVKGPSSSCPLRRQQHLGNDIGNDLLVLLPILLAAPTTLHLQLLLRLHLFHLTAHQPSPYQLVLFLNAQSLCG